MCVRGWVCVCVWGETVSGVRLCWLAWVPFVCVCLCVWLRGCGTRLGCVLKAPMHAWVSMCASLCVRVCVCVCQIDSVLISAISSSWMIQRTQKRKLWVCMNVFVEIVCVCVCVWVNLHSISKCVCVCLIREVAWGCGQIRLSWRCRAESSDQKEMLSLNLIAAPKCTLDWLRTTEEKSGPQTATHANRQSTCLEYQNKGAHQDSAWELNSTSNGY